jgi:hypothetical protein
MSKIESDPGLAECSLFWLFEEPVQASGEAQLGAKWEALGIL